MLWSAGVAVALVAAAASWLVGYRSAAPIENPLANAHFTRLTEFPGAERDAAMSPDGKFVAFRSDRDGPFDVFVGQTGTGRFVNLTQGREDDLRLPVRSQGFSGDGSEVWLSGGVDRRLRLMPLMGRGEPRVFLGEMVINVAWSPDGARLVYHTREDGDPIFVADPRRQPRRIVIDQPGSTITTQPGHSMAMIYFVQGVQATYEWDRGELRRLAEIGAPDPAQP
jgi:dipeptidyl aminopeptidase/acylaminoacyl peptidase